MKIHKKTKDLVKFSKISVGETFLINDKVFMRIDCSTTDHNIVNLSSGVTSFLQSDIAVKKIESEVVFEI